MRSSVLPVLLLVLAASLSSGCGYRFTASGGELPGGARSLYVPTFVNRTAEPGAEVYFTNALRQEASRAGLEGGEASDARIVGEVTQVTGFSGIVTLLRPEGSTVLQPRVTTFRVQAAATVRVYRGDELLANVAVSGFEDYLNVEGNMLETEANRRNALRRLSVTLMQQAYARLASGF
ncbi:MAG: LPS assembly lipoprotein LptE [Myxococcales bacterium]